MPPVKNKSQTAYSYVAVTASTSLGERFSCSWAKLRPFEFICRLSHRRGQKSMSQASFESSPCVRKTSSVPARDSVWFRKKPKKKRKGITKQTASLTDCLIFILRSSRLHSYFCHLCKPELNRRNWGCDHRWRSCEGKNLSPCTCSLHTHTHTHTHSVRQTLWRCIECFFFWSLGVVTQQVYRELERGCCGGVSLLFQV